MTDVADLEARIAALTARLDEFAAPPAVDPQAILPPNVNAGELITSAWGNNVTSSINSLRTQLGQPPSTGGAIQVVKAWDNASVPFISAGSYVGTTDAGGIMKIALGFTVTGGIRALTVMSGDYAVGTAWAARWGQDPAGVSVVVYNGNNTPRVSQATRLDYIAVGWQAS